MFDETDVQQFMRFYCRKKRLYRKKTNSKTKTIDLFERKFNTTAKTAKKKFCSYISTDVLHWFHCKKRKKKLFGFKKVGNFFFDLLQKKKFVQSQNLDLVSASIACFCSSLHFHFHFHFYFCVCLCLGVTRVCLWVCGCVCVTFVCDL